MVNTTYFNIVCIKLFFGTIQIELYIWENDRNATKDSGFTVFVNLKRSSHSKFVFDDLEGQCLMWILKFETVKWLCKIYELQESLAVISWLILYF